MKADVYKALQLLARHPDTYLIPMLNYITNGQGYGVQIDVAVTRKLIDKGYVAPRLHPGYYFITARGLKKL
jgi:hypothetical protein